MLSPEEIEMFEKMPFEKIQRWLNFWWDNGCWMFVAFCVCFIINDGWLGQLLIVIYAIYGTIRQAYAWKYQEYLKEKYKK